MAGTGTSPTDPCSASIFSQILGGNAIVCSKTFEDYEVSTGQKQIQSVADNAAKNYGADSVTAQVAQQTATAEETYVPQDVTDVTGVVAASSAGLVFGASCNGEPGLDLSIVGGPCLTYTLLREIGLGILLAVLAGVGIYVFAVVSPFVPKGRR